MRTTLISIKDTARARLELDAPRAQFEFRIEDWADRSRCAQELALSINGYEVSPHPRELRAKGRAATRCVDRVG